MAGRLFGDLRSGPGFDVIWLAIPALAAACYYALAIVSAIRWKTWLAAQGPADWTPPLSVLKPVHGRDPRFYEAIVSHAAQEYPEFELLFGVTDPNDAAIPDIERLQREFPARRISITVVDTHAPNAKVGVLAELARRAQYEVLLVNDSDIRVEANYFRVVAAPLRSSATGLVTCLYRGYSESPASHFEALAIATEFAPSVLVARLLGQAEFALGSTMVFRADALRLIGGFEPIGKYIADDYQLGFRIRQLGYRIEFAPGVVETNLGAGSWKHTWRHQVRWSRTIRVSRPGGYYGYVVTHATIWGLVAFAAGEWWAGTIALAIRIAAGVLIGSAILGDRSVLRRFWLIPFRDLMGFAVWAAGAVGNRVQWRDRSLRLGPGGVILPELPK